MVFHNIVCTFASVVPPVHNDYAAAARVLMGDAVDKMIVDTEGFRFADIETLDDVNMLPGIVKYGDLPAILSLSDPTKTEIRGE